MNILRLTYTRECEGGRRCLAKKVKVITHGFFFRKNMLETRCKCGCVYLTPKEKVFIREINDYFGRDTDFETKCPECKDVNHQRRKELEKASELE